MSTHKVSEIFVGAGAALSATGTALPSIAVQSGIVGTSMLTLNPAATSNTVSADPAIYVVNKLANGDFKRSTKIDGSSVIGFKALSYAPARKNVWAIGYHRASVAAQTPNGLAIVAGGAINVANSTEYNLNIKFKSDKQFYSERPEVLSIQFISSAAATQSTIADQIVAKINNSAFGASVSGIKQIIAVKIGDGTGVYGLFGATNFGVEINGLAINQFANTSYTEEIVYFSVHTDDASGFGATATIEVSTMDLGNGTYNQILNLEGKLANLLNRTSFPAQVPAYLALAAGVTSGAIAAFTATGTAGQDQVTFSAAATGEISAGSVIVISGNSYEVKYFASATVAVLTSALLTSPAATNVSAKAFYDVINITVRDITIQDGAGVGQFSQKSIFIATPAIAAGATGMATPSLEGQDLMDILNAWMPTTPLAPAAIVI